MTKYYSIIMLIAFVYAFTGGTVKAQQNVFSRSDVTTGNFGDGQLPWFYQTDNNNQGDPDNGNTVRNFVKIGHNSNTTMTTNVRFYQVNTLDFEAGATSARTINNSGGGLSASGGIYNASSATHTFNTPIGIDGATVQLHANSTGGLTFTDNIFINANTVEFGNLGSGQISVSGTMSGSGNVSKVGSNILTISGSNTYTGTTTVSGGTLVLQSDLSSSDVTVENGATLEIDGTITLKSLTVNTGGQVSITAGNALTVTNAIVNNGTITLESTSTSYSSLIPEGTITGTVSYERHVNGNSTLGDTNAIGDNDLISPPVSGQTFGDFATANPNLLANPGDATEKAFAPFDKTTGAYENYFTTTNAATVLDARLGYRAATNDTSTLTFSGTVITGSESYNIVNSGPTQADWNLIGNPYPSYILARDFLEHEVDTDVRNIDLFQPDTAAIYGYDGDVNNNTNSYTVYNLATTLPTTVIAPGQGFLVSADPADVAAYDVEFTPAIRTTGTDDDFIVGRGGSLINLELQLTTATDGAVTDFYFNANASLGLDPGYDAAIFGGTAPPFSIYSLLVEDNDGTPFIIQALGDMDFGDTTVALGVNANQGEQLTFSVSTNTLPSTVEVYLDDTVASTSTLLSSGDYVLTPATELIGTGRFYLRFSDSSLSTVENSFDDLTIYTNQAQRSIVISGQLVEHTIANIYDIQGRLVRSQQLDTTTTLHTIAASELGTGVYIVELSNDRTSKTEKIILN
ncbi:T9SS type A sorting domain-containing protein [Winogradskyella sp.]|uniref:T9SS type A sorting domain-containing protein n=1 Tax=Winogradskyella sp. TaxID=1883156 RepID=UPI001B2CC112|nr:T9SS type A sorting domain-containing protein [Winogradskyella sp.]MBO6881106.1 T9SS type A sorting domain-containing protein [Winogradskyella sp.]